MQWILVLTWLLLTNSERNLDYSIYVNNEGKKSSNILPTSAVFVFSFLSEAKWKNSPLTGQPEVSLGQLVYNYSRWLHHDDGRGHKPVAPSLYPHHHMPPPKPVSLWWHHYTELTADGKYQGPSCVNMWPPCDHQQSTLQPHALTNGDFWKRASGPSYKKYFL